MNIESYLDRNVLNRVGVDDDEGPPVPIPNTEVKLISADDTWQIGRASCRERVYVLV